MNVNSKFWHTLNIKPGKTTIYEQNRINKLN